MIIVYYEERIFVSLADEEGEAFDEVVKLLNLDPSKVGWDDDVCGPTYDGKVVETLYCDETTQVK